MKVLFTQDSDWLVRGPHQQHHLAEMLSLRGHEIRVIDYELLWKTLGKRALHSRRQVFPTISKIHDGATVTVIRPGIIKIPWLDYLSLLFSHEREINHQIREFKPDVIVGWGILNSYIAMKVAGRNNIPFLYYWIDILDRLIPFSPFQAIAKLVESRTLKRSDRILVINDKLRDYVMKLGAPPKRTQVLRAGVNTKQFAPGRNHRTVRKQYGFNENDIVLFFMGWLYNFSGLKEVALQLTKTRNHNLKLLIVGEGDAFDELQQIRESYTLGERLILAGKKPYHEIPAFVDASDICLLPACPNEQIMKDIVPIKMYEYMAMKKPVIATRLPGVLKEFGEGNGVVFVDQPENVVAKAIELVQNGTLERLGSRSRSFVGRYSWDIIADEFERILEDVLKEK